MLRVPVRVPLTFLTLSLFAVLSTPVLAQATSRVASDASSGGDRDQTLPGRRPPTLGLQVTLTDNQVTGSFTKGKTVIYFDALRGEATESEDPEATPFALDIKILDETHAPFLVRGSGPTTATAAWYDDLAESDDVTVDVNIRMRAYTLLPGAAAALRRYAEQYHPDRWELSEIADLMESLTLEDIYDPDVDSSSPGAISVLAKPTYKHVVTIKTKPAYNMPWEFDHSAVELKIYDSKGRRLNTVNTCNHGTCADKSSMKFKCDSTYTKLKDKAYVWDVMCDKLGYKRARHTCNTDTRQEYLSIKGSSTEDWGICNIPYVYAPKCD